MWDIVEAISLIHVKRPHRSSRYRAETRVLEDNGVRKLLKKRIQKEIVKKGGTDGGSHVHENSGGLV